MTQKTPAMSAAAVRPTSLPISELLANRSPAKVPRYQRSYAWEDEQVGDLIQDVELLLGSETGARGHFYGGMVAIRMSDSTEPSGSAHEVVDGQQRLATFCILLAQLAIRADELRQIGLARGDNETAQKLAILTKSIRNEYLYYQRYDVDRGIESPQPRVRLSGADDDVFQSLLKGEPVSRKRNSHELLRKAAIRLREELVVPKSPEGDLDRSLRVLQRIRDAVLFDSFVIHIVGENKSSGYRLFAVLNDRGARLTVADLLRSYTLEMLDAAPELCDKGARIWDDILTAAGEHVDDFLKAYFTSLTGKRPRRDDLFDETKDLLFPGNNTPPQEVISTLTAMARELTAFSAIRDGAWPYTSEQQMPNVSEWQRSRLRRLVVTLRHELSHPLLLAARACCDERSFAELVHLIELFAFRYKNACGAHAGPASGSYYAECKRLRTIPSNSAVDFAKLRGSLRDLLDKRASNSTFRNVITEFFHYDAGSAAKANIRHLLTTIEDYRPWIEMGAEGPPVPTVITVTDLSQVTIEHIYPVGCPSPDPTLQPHVNQLGNLSYWGPDENSDAGNSDFASKVPAYAASKVRLNNELATFGRWDLAALKAREERLIEQACLIFTV